MTSRELRRILRDRGCIEVRQKWFTSRGLLRQVPNSDPGASGRGRSRPFARHRAATRSVSRERMAPAMKTYSVAYDLDEAGWWVATVRELPGCHTQGRTIEQTRNRIREAMELFDVPGTAPIKETIHLPAPMRRRVETAERAKKRAATESARAQAATRQAVRELVARGLSLRDAGELLGVTRARAHQLLHDR
jgi:hypothetical protein